MSNTMEQAMAFLIEAGWTDVGSRRHYKFRCPCGEHQISFAKTASDWRAQKNLMRDIRATGCPSITSLEHKQQYPWPEGAVLKCLFCARELEVNRYKKDWVYHDGNFACLRHPGVDKWSKQQRREKRKTKVEISVDVS
jgi:hypothetical protein